jgi:peptide/nickel transport system ATP-binding protein
MLRLLPAAGRILGGGALRRRDLLQPCRSRDARRARRRHGDDLPGAGDQPQSRCSPSGGRSARCSNAISACAASGARERARTARRRSASPIRTAARRVSLPAFRRHEAAGDDRHRAGRRSALLIADEPTTALDVTIQAQILDLLRRLQAERGMGMLLITHDLGVVARMAHRVGVMYAGEIVEEGRARLSSPAAPSLHAETVRRLARSRAARRAAGDDSRQVPPLAMPAGCRFAERCAHAWERCREQSPDWREVGVGHRVRCHWRAEARRRSVIGPPRGRSGGGRSPPAIRERAVPAQVTDLRVHFPIRRGILQRTVGHVARRWRLAGTRARPHAGAGRRIGLRQDDGRQGHAATDQADAGSVSSGGERTGRPRAAKRCGRCARAHADDFPGSVRLAQPAPAVGEIIAEGMSALGMCSPTAATRGARRSPPCCNRSACPTEAPALSARVLRRPAPAHRHRPRAGRAAGTDRSATSRPRRSTSRCRRRSSTC